MKSTIIKIFLACGLLGLILGFVAYQLERSWSEVPAGIQSAVLSEQDVPTSVPPTATSESATPTVQFVAAEPTATTKPAETKMPAQSIAEDKVVQQAVLKPEPNEKKTANAIAVQKHVIEIEKLVVPQLGLDHEVVDVPIVNGLWDTDNLAHDIGLLEGAGQRPKDARSMIFAAHAALMIAPIKGPFFHLDDLEIGSEIIYIKNDTQYIYRVSEKTLIAPDDRTTLSNNNGDQIILVTCGSYNFITAEFDERLVVFADLTYSGPYSAQ